MIRDFDKASGDDIVLGVIDADATLDGNQAFRFIGTSAFSGTPGELRCHLTRGGAIVFADVDGDGSSDFALVIHGHVTSAEDLQFAL